MGERYYLTGVQLGLLRAFAEQNQLWKIRDLLDEIQLKQFIEKT